MAEDKDTEEISERKLVYEAFFHEADRVSQRTDWFLIFHVILLEAFISSKDIIPLMICFLGLLITYLWLMNGIRSWAIQWQLGNYMARKSIMGEKISKRYNYTFQYRRRYIPFYINWATPSPSFSIIIPILWLIAWEGILFYYWNIELVFFSIGTMIFISFLTAIIGPGPIIRKRGDATN